MAAFALPALRDAPLFISRFTFICSQLNNPNESQQAMTPQLKLVHDGITPHLKKLEAALRKPIVVTIPATRPHPYLGSRKLAKSLGPVVGPLRPRHWLRLAHLKRPGDPLQQLTPSQKAEMDRQVRAEIDRRIKDL